MIKKVSEQWDNVEQDLERQGNANRQHLQSVAEKVGEVRKALRTMCRASVTRTSLKEAVSEVLEAILLERGEEIIAAIPGLRERRVASAAPAEASIAEAMESVDQLRGKLDAIEARFAGAVDSSDERIGSFDDRLGSVQLELTDLRSNIDGGDCQVRDELGDVSERLVKIEKGLGDLEESVPVTTKSLLSELELRLRKEISEMTEQLTLYVGELKEMLGRVEEGVPSWEKMESMGADVSQRLGRIEESFSRVCDQVDHIDSTTPQIESMGERFKELNEWTASAQVELTRNTESVEEIRATLGSRLDELEEILGQVLANWNSDQSEMAQRLGCLRDSLRDQLNDIHQQVEGDQKGLWNRLRGNKDTGLKLSGEDLGSLSSKLEGIITGLETVISKKKET